MENQSYKKYTIKHAKKSNLFLDCLYAFFVGGAICVIGQGILAVLVKLGIEADLSKKWVTIILIFAACLLTGLGVFDDLAKKAGAGTLVPITGFANAICSVAIDNKAEGYIFGVGGNMFKIAGPVIVYGVSASVAYGIIYWITTIF